MLKKAESFNKTGSELVVTAGKENMKIVDPKSYACIIEYFKETGETDINNIAKEILADAESIPGFKRTGDDVADAIAVFDDWVKLMEKDDEMAGTEAYDAYNDMLQYCKDNGIDMYELVDRVASTIPTLKYNNRLTPEENAYAYWETYKEAICKLVYSKMNDVTWDVYLTCSKLNIEPNLVLFDANQKYNVIPRHLEDNWNSSAEKAWYDCKKDILHLDRNNTLVSDTVWGHNDIIGRFANATGLSEDRIVDEVYRVTPNVYRVAFAKKEAVEKYLQTIIPFKECGKSHYTFLVDKTEVTKIIDPKRYSHILQYFKEIDIDGINNIAAKILSDVENVTGLKRTYDSIADAIVIFPAWVKLTEKDDTIACTKYCDVCCDMFRYSWDKCINILDLVDKVCDTIPTLQYDTSTCREENAYKKWETYKSVLL